MIPRPCRSILHHVRPSQLPHHAKYVYVPHLCFPKTVVGCRGSDGLVMRFPVTIPDLQVPVPPAGSRGRSAQCPEGGFFLRIWGSHSQSKTALFSEIGHVSFFPGQFSENVRPPNVHCSLTAGIGHGLATALPWPCHGPAVALPWHCHDTAMTLLWHYWSNLKWK